MKYKKIAFFILEKIEKKKIEKQSINIKNLYLRKKKYSIQLKSLLDYYQEYLNIFFKKIKSGIFIYEWNNYYKFLTALSIIVKQQKEIIKKNSDVIKINLNNWSQSQSRLKIWEYLNLKSKKNTLKRKKIQELIIHDEYYQLKMLKKECYSNVRNN